MHFIGVFTDVTELRAREAEGFKAQKLEALGQLAAGVAHDFNNILSITDGYARMIEREAGANSIVAQHAEKIRITSQRGADLTKQMLTFSRHKIIEENVVDLCAVVMEEEVLLRPLVDASIKFDIEVSDEPCHVKCTPDNVTQIIMNLTVNARDAVGAAGRIAVHVGPCAPPEFSARRKDGVEDESGWVCLSVSDNGSGIPDDVVERMFDPFFTTKDQGKGTGLGLSMVYGLVQEIGGQIDVSSVMG